MRAAARREGRAAAIPIKDLAAARTVLAARGYEPRIEDGALRLVNCPFHALSEHYPALVCGMNLALLEGLLEDADGLRARMDPRPGQCCVAIQPSKNNDD